MAIPANARLRNRGIQGTVGIQGVFGQLPDKLSPASCRWSGLGFSQGFCKVRAGAIPREEMRSRVLVEACNLLAKGRVALSPGRGCQARLPHGVRRAVALHAAVSVRCKSPRQRIPSCRDSALQVSVPAHRRVPRQRAGCLVRQSAAGCRCQRHASCRWHVKSCRVSDLPWTSLRCLERGVAQD